MQQGTIVRKNEDGHYGFISIEGSEKDIFFHANELQGVTFEELEKGDTVSFEVTDSPKGPNATKVSKVA